MCPTPTRRRDRDGFTLVEMLVVIVMILVLAGLAVLIVPGFKDNSKVPRASDQLQGWLLVAKQRAVRDRAVRGLRLMIDPAGNGVTQLQYVEQPDPITCGPISPIAVVSTSYGGTLTVPAWYSPTVPVLPTIPTLPPPDPRGTVGVGAVFLTNNLVGTVLPGDLLEIVEPPSLSVITNVTASAGPPTTPGLTALNLATPVPGYTAFTTTNYRVTRRPQQLIGEPELSISKDTMIAPTLSQVGPLRVMSGTGPFDILFTPTGQAQVFDEGASPPRLLPPSNIILWVRDRFDKDLGMTVNLLEHRNQLLVIYQRTGLIGAQPPDLSNATNPPFSYFGFTTDGQSSGL
jgi:prepilin-type N-terminal cleavage/methylation domain-containing protein